MAAILLTHQLTKNLFTMKTMILSTAMMVLMTATTVLAGIDNPITTVPAPKVQQFNACVNLTPNNVIEFRVVKPQDDKVVMKIYGQGNVKMYKRNLHKNSGIALHCDMSQARRGNYTCVIEKNGKGQYFIRLPKRGDWIEFKFTRGDWSSEEVDKFG
jgi:hypothetical protein